MTLTHHLHLLPYEAALLVEGLVGLRAVQDDLVAPPLPAHSQQLVYQPAQATYNKQRDPGGWLPTGST